MNSTHELKAEYESGQKMLEDLEVQQSNLKTTLLRISGAIQEPIPVLPFWCISALRWSISALPTLVRITG